jgi:hypothetical protein
MMRDLVALCAFPKSGVTYLSFLMFHSLFSDDCDIHELERKYVIDIHLNPPPTNDGRWPFQVIKTHFPYAPQAPYANRIAKAIYLLRDPIDVMMSAWDFAHLIQGVQGSAAQEAAFRNYARRWVETGGTGFPEYGSWVHHVRSWRTQADVPVYMVTYKDLVDRPDRELPAILDFLGVKVSAERQRTAIERSSMKAMAELEEKEVANRKDGIFFRKELSPGYSQGHRFINKGYRDTSATVLTEDERRIAERTFANELPLLRGRE